MPKGRMELLFGEVTIINGCERNITFLDIRECSVPPSRIA